ncbi:MAG: transglutaminase domain-containing protein [Verrucomicrobiaceae bacterium]|nr:transglutaminase domain-containing protein [Verrucomicrobiaceae bacterium]
MNQKRAGSLLTGLMIFLILVVIGNILHTDSQPIDEATQQRFRQIAVAAVNAERQTQGIKKKVVTDAGLQNWLDGQTETFINETAEISPDLFLKRLPSKQLTLSQASLYYISAASPGSLAGKLDFWKEAFHASTNVVAMRLCRHSDNQIGCLFIAAKKVPSFNLSLFNKGQSEFYVTCRNCDKPHLGKLEKSDLAIAIKCSHCNHSYDLIAADLLGNYHRATHYLQGYSPPQAIGAATSTRLAELTALWSEVVTRCRYSKDFSGISEKKDSWQTPPDTYSLRNGDCEDTSLLLADWLIARGFTTRVVIGKAPGKDEHAWCVTELDGKQYLLETTLESIPAIPPETQSEAVRYQPRFSFDRQKIHFIKESPDIIFDYFSPELWQSYAYPVPQTSSVPSIALNSLESSEASKNP